MARRVMERGERITSQTEQLYVGPLEFCSGGAFLSWNWYHFKRKGRAVRHNSGVLGKEMNLVVHGLDVLEFCSKRDVHDAAGNNIYVRQSTMGTS